MPVKIISHHSSIFLSVNLTLLISLTIGFSSSSLAQNSRSAQTNFNKQNLVAWCIVPFDVKNRGPFERAQMLKGLGITKLAYDWRDHHIPTFDQELDALNSHRISLQAFWMMPGADPSNEYGVNEVFKFLERRKVGTQIWCMFIPTDGFDKLTQEAKIEVASKSIAYVAKRAAKIDCQVGLYNHDGWFGEPENQLEIVKRLNMPNVGLVYNFNHAQDQIDRFPVFFPKILPHLIALNLAGLKKGDRHIYPIGEGDSEQEMIRIIRNSKYTGPIGIINEDTHPDAETGLKMNMDGLKKILETIGDKRAAKTYN
ncbi:MAG: sugar phosphate isomerase/epimerase family protein [bacterium]